MRCLSHAKRTAIAVITVLFASLLAVSAPITASAAGPASESGAVQTVAAEGTVTGRITSDVDLVSPVAQLLVPDQKTGYHRWKSSSYHAFADGSGSFTITGVPAGTYTAVFFDVGQDTIAPQYYQGTDNTTLAKSFTVTKGGTVASINAKLVAGVTVSGKVTTSSGKAIEGASVLVARKITVDKKPFWEYLLDITAADGTYSVTGIAPGTLAVKVLGPSGKGYSEAFYGGGKSFESSKTFSLTSGKSKSGVNIKLTKKLTVGTPKVTGTVAVGSTLKAKPGTWSKGTTLSYQWYANGKAVKKATKSTLKLTKSYKGKKLTVKVTGKKSGYATGYKTSKATAKVATAATPKISGTAKVGKKLTAKTGTWTTGTKLTYKWYANGKVIKKATTSTFTVTKSQKGKKITVKVTGKKSGYATVAKTSKATKKVS